MTTTGWPSLEEQLSDAHVKQGSALERLIRENQEFDRLGTWESDDRVGLPPWLRVHWRKAHPQDRYSQDDPSGGYPRALKRVHGWMLANQELPPGT